jgi:hypothetical protein
MSLTGAISLTSTDIYSNDDVRQHAIGALGMDKHGDLYRYTRLAADVSAGYLLVSLGREANHQNIVLGAAAAAGAYSVEVTVGATAVDADEYVGGYLAFSDVAPEGEWYRIASHDASAGSGDITVTLERSLVSAATTSSQVALVRNPWMKPAVSQLIAERACGVTVVDVDVSEAAYAWLKTKGVAPVLTDTTGYTVGFKVTISDEVNGSVGLYSDVDAECVVGQGMQTGTATEFNPVWLCID